MEADQYEHESQAEDYVDYGAEGYHPVELGQKFNYGKYVVIQKLGWGHFSTVWLAYKEQTKQYLALKIQRSKQSHTESAIDQLQILTEVRKHEQDPEWISFLEQYDKERPNMFKRQLCRPLLLLDSFPHFGIHGKHMCSAFQLMGPNLLDLIQHYQFKDKRMPLWLVKKITRDVLVGLVYLHERCQVIHTDLKPENIMIKMETYEELQLIEQLKNYKVKPLSMKYLKNLYASKNPKNKKKLEKKKQKKKKVLEQQNEVKGENPGEEEGELSQSQSENVESSSISKQESSISVIEPLTVKKVQQIPNLPNNSQSNSFVSESMVDEGSSSTPISSSVPNNEASSSSKAEQKVENEQKQSEEGDVEDGVDMTILDWKSVKIKLNNKLFFKIVDMGNACFTHKHFTDDIQTRQYRSPQVILGHQYDCNTDIFSLGCIIYELMTNNFLFKPKKISGIKKNQDHLYQMMETLGIMDKDFAISGKYSGEVFNKKGKLLNGNPKKIVPLSRMLHQKYGYDPQTAAQTEQFLLPLLSFEPKFRIDARSCLKSKWLWT